MFDEPSEIVERCVAGRPCCEVVERLIAADLAEYVTGFPEHAERLRAGARLWADAHQHGSSTALEDAE